MTTSDTDRAIQHNPNQDWPDRVSIELVWRRDGVSLTRTLTITGDYFFGLNGYGAPMEGAALIGRIENLRRMGPPIPSQLQGKSPAPAARKVKNAKKR